MKNIEELKKELLEAIKSDPDSMDKIPDIIEVAIKRVAEIKEGEIEDAEKKVADLTSELDALKKEQEEKEMEEQKEKEMEEQKEKEMEESKTRLEACKKEQEELEEQMKGKEEEVGDGHDSDVTHPDEAKDVGDQPKGGDEGERDTPKIDRATGELEEKINALKQEQKELEEKLGIKAEQEEMEESKVSEQELEEAVKIAFKKGQDAAVEELTNSSTIGQALITLEKIKEAIFPLVKEDVNVEGFEGNVYNMLKEKEEALEQMKKQLEQGEKDKGELEETMNLVNQKLKDLKEEIKNEQELEEKKAEVLDKIDDPSVKEKAEEASKDITLESFDTFKTLVETMTKGDKEETVILESNNDKNDDLAKPQVDHEKIKMMKQIVGME